MLLVDASRTSQLFNSFHTTHLHSLTHSVTRSTQLNNTQFNALRNIDKHSTFISHTTSDLPLSPFSFSSILILFFLLIL